VVVPEHGYLDSRGSGWQCERGFKRDGAGCVALEIPANSHISYAGDGWACDNGFRRKADACESI
jgi:hypothetical protein